MASEIPRGSDPINGRHLEQPDDIEVRREDEPCPFIELLRAKIQAALQHGGPAVDYRLLHLLVSRQLSEDAARCVWREVLTWQTWNQAFREIASSQTGSGHDPIDE